MQHALSTHIRIQYINHVLYMLHINPHPHNTNIVCIHTAYMSDTCVQMQCTHTTYTYKRHTWHTFIQYNTVCRCTVYTLYIKHTIHTIPAYISHTHMHTIGIYSYILLRFIHTQSTHTDMQGMQRTCTHSYALLETHACPRVYLFPFFLQWKHRRRGETSGHPFVVVRDLS